MKAPPRDYLGCVDVELRLNGRVIPIALDIYGHYVMGFGATSCSPKESAGLVIDRVMLENNDISVELPSEAMEVITEMMNEPGVEDVDCE
jgi:hypothetical protein